MSDEHLHMGMAAVADALHKARIEVEAYRIDAERYRWLKSKAYVGSVVTAKGTQNFWTTVMSLDCHKGESFDESLDAAMQRDAAEEGISEEKKNG